MNVHVVSTGKNAPTRHICEASVRAQTASDVVHHYIEAADQRPPKPASRNVWEVCRELPRYDVVVWLDGDDWLAGPHVIDRVVDMHRRGAWVTYGQYMTSDGRKGHCAPHRTANYRREPWLASHLRTFRAGLMRYVDADDLQLDGEWVSLGVDVAIMLPLLELAGPDHVTFCPDVLAIYNTSTAWETTATGAELAHERRVVERIRAKTPKGRLACI